MAGYFPSTLCPHQNIRDPFAGYGQFHNIALTVDNEDEFHIHPQYDHMYHSNLSAISPTLPIRLPNNIHSLYEPCMQKLTERHTEIQQKLQHLYQMKQKLSLSQTIQRRSFRKFIKRADKIMNMEEDAELHFNVAMAQLPTWFKGLAENVSDIIGENPYKVKVNTLYEGGAISVINADDAYVSFVSGENMSDLIASKVSSNSLGVKLNEEAIYKMPGNQKIYQVDSKNVHNRNWLVTRLKEQTRLFEIFSDNSIPDLLLCSEDQWDDSITSVGLNPYIPGEYIVSSFNSVHVVSPEKNPCQVLSSLEPRFKTCDKWRSIFYAAHPKQIITCDNTALDMYDTRKAQTSSTALFELPHKNLHSNERITCCQAYSKPFYHLIGTDYSLILLDQRFPNHPVLHISHTMLSPPAYVKSISNINGPDSVLLASHLNSEVHCHQLSVTNNSIPPQCKGSPWRISSLVDFAMFSKRQGIEVDPWLIERKLKIPVIGTSGYYNSQKDTLTIFQLSSIGDLFQQTYTTNGSLDRTYNSNAGSELLSLNDEQFAHCKPWIEEAQKQISSTSSEVMSQNAELVDISDVETGLFNAPKLLLSHQSCCACFPDIIISDSDMIDNNEQCLGCGILLKSSFEIKAAVEENKAIPEISGAVNSGAVNSDAVNSVLKITEWKEIAEKDYNSRLYWKLWNGDNNIKEELELRDEAILKKRAKQRKKRSEKKGKKIQSHDDGDEGDDDTEVVEVVDTEKEGVIESDRIIDSKEKSKDLNETDKSMDSQNTQHVDDSVSNELSNSTKTNLQTFVTEEDVVQSLLQKDTRKIDSQASLSSYASRFTDFSQSPGFTLTPSRLRKSASASIAKPPVPGNVSKSQDKSSQEFAFLTPPLTQSNSGQSVKKKTPKPLKKRRKIEMGF